MFTGVRVSEITFYAIFLRHSTSQISLEWKIHCPKMGQWIYVLLGVASRTR